MARGAVSWRNLEPLVVLRGKIADKHYRSILADHFHPRLKTLFPGERPMFQDDNAPVHMAPCIQTWFDEHSDEVEHLM